MSYKEKVKELCDSYACNILHGDSIIEKWLAENQPEPAVIGLSDEQILDFGREQYGDNWECDCFVRQFMEWQKTQTFAQPASFPQFDEKCKEVERLTLELEQLKLQLLKPSWNDAPEWANYRAQDSDGQWKWFDIEPKEGDDYFTTSGYGNEASAQGFIKNWQQTLEQRPQPPAPIVGQIWHYGAIESLVVYTTYSEVAIVNTYSIKMAVLDKAEFLSKYQYHAATL